MSSPSLKASSPQETHPTSESVQKEWMVLVKGIQSTLNKRKRNANLEGKNGITLDDSPSKQHNTSTSEGEDEEKSQEESTAALVEIDAEKTVQEEEEAQKEPVVPEATIEQCASEESVVQPEDSLGQSEDSLGESEVCLHDETKVVVTEEDKEVKVAANDNNDDQVDDEKAHATQQEEDIPKDDEISLTAAIDQAPAGEKEETLVPNEEEVKGEEIVCNETPDAKADAAEEKTGEEQYEKSSADA